MYLCLGHAVFIILIVANASADVSADTTSDLAFKNCLFLFKIQLRTPQDIANVRHTAAKALQSAMHFAEV